MVIGNYVKVEKEGSFNISPSSLHSWFENSSVWYTNQVANKGTFKGNTNTYFGTICHAIAESYALDDVLTIDDVNEYLSKLKDDNVVDEWYIGDNFNDARKAIIDFMMLREKPSKVEFQVIYEPVQGYTIGGTVDAMAGSKITDYKTCSSIPSKMSIAHKYQLVTYALAMQGQGEKVTEIEVVYIKRPDVKGKVSEKTGKVIGIKNTEIKAIVEPITAELIAEVKAEIKLLIKCLKWTINDTDYSDYSGLTKEELVEMIFRHNPLSYIQE